MRSIACSLAALAGLAAASLTAQSSSIVAIQGARIVPVQGRVLETGTIVFRDGLIAAVGAKEAVPAGATVIAGKGLTVYPGLIDMGSATGLDLPATPRAENPQTTEDVERVKGEYLRRAHLRAADHLSPGQTALARAAAAGITAILARPGGDAFRGQSALIQTALAPDEPQIGAVADPRKGALVIRSPVALHVTFSERPAGGNAYPNSLMGVIAFVRQAFLDAQHAQAAERYAGNSAVPVARRLAARLPYDAATEALQEALARRLPVAFRGDSSREILRALDMAKAFKLETIVTGAREADLAAADLKTADARVILSLDFPRRSESLAPDADEALSVLRARANAPRTAAALVKAGVPFAFESGSLSDPRDFIRNAAKAVENGLSREDALRALTLQAATLAGVADRMGTLEAGKIANVLVTEGDLFDEKMTIKHVFVEGRAVNLDVPPPAGNNRRTP
jgi:imidazolonepropionase-like amidohydrolase